MGRAEHDEVLARAAAGELAVFAAVPEGHELPPHDDDEFWAEGTIDGAWLSELLRDDRFDHYRSGILIVGARIVGDVNLRDADLSRPVGLMACQLGPHRIDLRGARARAVRLAETSCARVEAKGLHVVGGPLDLYGARVPGGVDLNRATVEGQLDCRHARLGGGGSTGKQPGLSLVNARLERSLQLGEAEVHGGLHLVDAVVGGVVDATAAQVLNPGADAIDARGAHLEGSVVMARGFVAEGRCGFEDAVIGGSLRCAQSRFSHPEGQALSAGGLDVRGGLVMHDLVAEGEVTLSGATVRRSINLAGAQLSNPGGRALRTDAATVTGGLFLRRGFLACGEVRLVGMSIGGDLDAFESSFANPGGMALNAARVRLTGSLFLTRTQAQGMVRIESAVVSGNVESDEARLVAGPDPDDPDDPDSPGAPAGAHGPAFQARGAHVIGNVVLGAGFVAEGEVRLAGAVIGGDLDAAGAELRCPDGTALDASGAHVTGALVLDDGFRAKGVVVLRGTTAGSLQDESACWPDRLDIDGFRFGTLDCADCDRGWRRRRQWLRRQLLPGADGYVHLAGLYRSVGEDRDARKILMERHNARLRPPKQWRPHLPSGWRGLVTRSRRRLLRLSIGHGYAPARSLFVAVPLVVGLSLWLGYAARHDMLVPVSETPATSGGTVAVRSSGCNETYPCIQPVVFALDNVVPIVELGQKSRWATDQSHRGDTWIDDGRWLSAAVWTTSAVGWILATLVAASFTQVVRRE
jgi:hypothetical protein